MKRDPQETLDRLAVTYSPEELEEMSQQFPKAAHRVRLKQLERQRLPLPQAASQLAGLVQQRQSSESADSSL